MTFSDETLIAYADGELDAVTRAALETAMTADPALAERIARHRALRARVEGAFAPILTEPVPERLLASARGAAGEPFSAQVVALRRRPPARWSWPQWGAIAASLIVGALLSPLLPRASSDRPVVEARGEHLVAGGILARALSEQLASAQPEGTPVRIGVTFREHDGAYCRTFSLREPGMFAGLACREHDAWRIEALGRRVTEPGGEYRQAASALPPAVADTLANLIDGQPLDAAGETAARARGWNP